MILVILYQIFVIWLAYKNSQWSNPTEAHKIKHWLNGLCHITAGGLVGFFFGWWLFVSLLLITRVVFDVSMNLFRKKDVGYVSPSPDSKIDKLERDFIFWLSSIIYKSRTIITADDIEKTAIGFRITIFLTGIILLFI